MTEINGVRPTQTWIDEAAQFVTTVTAPPIAPADIPFPHARPWDDMHEWFLEVTRPSPIFEHLFRESLAQAAAHREAELTSWLETVIADPAGRELVKALVYKHEAEVIKETTDRLAYGTPAPESTEA